MSSPECVQKFLKSLKQYAHNAPGQSVDGTPREIVLGVVSQSSRLGRFSEDDIEKLVRQLVMAVKAHGHRFNLQVHQLQRPGKVEVRFVR